MKSSIEFLQIVQNYRAVQKIYKKDVSVKNYENLLKDDAELDRAIESLVCEIHQYSKNEAAIERHTQHHKMQPNVNNTK